VLDWDEIAELIEDRSWMTAPKRLAVRLKPHGEAPEAL
jgi:hypothetical protein